MNLNNYQKLVSVIMPAFNVERYISDAILSVIEQTYENFELIIIDDGSTDKTSVIASSFLSDSRIRMIHQKNSGAAAARNTGVKASLGEYFAFIDSDDYWMPQKLSTQLQVFDNYLDVDACGAQIHIVDVDRRVVSQYPYPKSFYYGKGFPQILFTSIVNMTTGVFKKALFEKHGLLDVNCEFAEDYELFLRFARDAIFYVVPEVLAHVRKGNNYECISYKYGDRRREYVIKKIIPNFIEEHGGKEYISKKDLLRLKGQCYKNRADEQRKYYNSIYWYIRSIVVCPFQRDPIIGILSRTLKVFGLTMRGLKRWIYNGR